MVYAPGGSEVVTTAILQRRQSYTQNGDQTKDTLTCAASRHTTIASGGYPCTPFPAMDPPEFRPPGTQCEAYSGPAPSFLRLNSVQPYTVAFSVTDPRYVNLSVQEVIDEMSAQLSADLMYSLRGVRLVGGSCYLSFMNQQDADSCRALPLTLRGTSLHLEDVATGTTVLSLSGVPHNATDDDVITVLSAFGSVVGPVEQRVYKGVDTGERVVRVRLRLAVPRWVWLDDCRVCIKTIRPEDVTNLSRRKSFRSHISVQLMPVSEDSPPIPPLPTSTGPLPLYTTSPMGPTVSSAVPFNSGSTPSIPVIPNSTESQVSFLSGASASTPNIFQETPFIFPKPHSNDSSGLRRINSVMGTMSLGDSEEPQVRSASSPPTATLTVRNAISDGENTGQSNIQHSPNTARKAMHRHKPSRKISKMSTDPRKVNGETSSSDQDSPQKPGRRRPSSVYFKRPGASILNRTVSVDQTDGTGYEATCSERERSNSDISSRLSICKRKMSTTGRESGKVPWCGCWGNGCI